jgi:phosphatidate cytidylyltransferase
MDCIVKNSFITRFFTAIVLLNFLFVLFFFFPPYVFSIVLLAALFYILCAEWTTLFNPHSYLFWIIMPTYPIMPFVLLLLLNHDPHYRHVLLILYALVCTFDTSAYIIGSAVGFHKIIPSISPNKTWEGLCGGYIISLCMCILIISIYQWRYLNLIPEQIVAYIFHNSGMIISISFMSSMCAFFGDLFESWLKRRAHVKNSGSLLPGHGGLLDRFDSIFFAVVFFYFYKESLSLLFLCQ